MLCLRICPGHKEINVLAKGETRKGLKEEGAMSLSQIELEEYARGKREMIVELSKIAFAKVGGAYKQLAAPPTPFEHEVSIFKITPIPTVAEIKRKLGGYRQ